jgi:hypothetical protein
MHERIVIELDGQRNVRCGVPAEREAGGVDASPDCRFRGIGPTEARFPSVLLAARRSGGWETAVPSNVRRQQCHRSVGRVASLETVNRDIRPLAGEGKLRSCAAD